MKAGIITLFGDNYGNKLQNLAVQKIIEGYNIEAETVLVDVKQGIKPASQNRIKKLNPSYIIKVLNTRFKNKYFYKNERDGILRSIRFFKKGEWKESLEKRKQAFLNFSEKHLRIAKNRISLINAEEEWLHKYDFFICGSDQVWNPTYPGTSSIFFLQFTDREKRIALAPSIGLSKLPEHVKRLYAKWIEEIPHLSVREKNGARIIKELTGRDAVVLPDPTLCVSCEEWEKVEEKPNFDTEEPYVFTYFLGNETNKYRKYVEKYAKTNGYKIINVFDLREPEYYDVNPAGFIYLIHHAKAVFTDSFHGSVFSIIMKTPFVVFDRIELGGKGMSSRIETLLETFSLENRKFPVNIEDINEINFTECDKTIEGLREKTDEFLKNAFFAKVQKEQQNETFVLRRKEDCSGCSSCVNICPKQCITMKTDAEGFYYPVIDKNLCVHCGICQKTCPSINEQKKMHIPQAYVGYSRSNKIRYASSSGGIFSVLAEEILSRGGWVYGAVFDEQFIVRHVGIHNSADIGKMRMSKYVQSDVRGVFHSIKEQLNKGELVFFSGTPCQVEGLLSYLGNEYENLYTQDIICHGVPSPMVWKAYLDLIKGVKKRVCFRDKKYGWHYFSMRIQTDKGRHIKRLNRDTYIRLFLDNVILRPSCYTCHFKKEIRNSDFTLADCWNADGLGLSLKDDDKGLSMVFVNSKKAKELLKTLNPKVVLEEIDYESALKTQSAITKSVQKNEQRAIFFESAIVNGYQQTIAKWYSKNIIADAKKELIYMKTKIKKIIKGDK